MYRIMETQEYKQLSDPSGLIGKLFDQYKSNGQFDLKTGIDGLFKEEKEIFNKEDFNTNINNTIAPMYFALEDMFYTINKEKINPKLSLPVAALGVQHWLASAALAAKEVHDSFTDLLPQYKHFFEQGVGIKSKTIDEKVA